MWGRGIDEIDRELTHLATVYTDVRSRGGHATTLAIDELLDERLMSVTVPDESPTEEFVPIELSDPWSR